MKTAKQNPGKLVVGCVLACCLISNIQAQILPPPDGGGDDGGTNTYTPPPDIPNYAKYVYQNFSIIDTNNAASNDTNLYKAILAFADDTTPSPSLQIVPYQDGLLMKASHFDYSSETDRDFTLVVNDSLEVPLFKAIDLANVTTNNGWLVQGTVPHGQVADTMYFLVGNISRTYNAFFRIIPYSGPEITLSGYNDYDVVSNTVSLQATITDLSGVTNEAFALTVADLPAYYALGASNTFAMDTAYAPNGLNAVKLTVGNAARVFDTNNIPDNQKLYFSGEQSVSLDFENYSFLAFASDWCPPDVGTNYVYYYVNGDTYIDASIAKPDGSLVAAFAGNTGGATYVAIPFTFTEADGVTPYSNDTYVVTFAASATGVTNTMTITNIIDRDGNIRPPNGCLLTYQWDDPSDPTWNYMNNHADSAIAGNLLTLYQQIYADYGLTQYGTGDVGTNRNAAQCLPYNAQYKSWKGILGQLTNYYFSELTIAEAHGTGGFLGGAKYLTNTIDSHDLEKWVAFYPDKKRWRLRKATIFACYSADTHLNEIGYPNWADACGVRPNQIQNNSYMYKNCGLFFGDVVGNFYSDVELGGNKTTAEIAEIVDQTWVCGRYQYPGGCDPTYSWRYACQTTVNRFQDFDKTKPVAMGFVDCVYTSNQDDALRNLDTSGVKEP